MEPLVSRNAGHPADGRPGFDLMFLDMDTEDELKSFVKVAQKKFWKTWTVGVGEVNHKPIGVMYKPCGVNFTWSDSPQKPHPGRIVPECS